MQIKIYANEKPVYLTATLDAELKAISEKEGTLLYDGEKPTAPLSVIRLLNDKKNSAAIIVAKDLHELKKDFFTAFDIIEAAGGIVQNEQKDILFIFRRGKWDLPKGKMDEGENAETAAEREIEEETGVKGLTLKRKIGETYHIYREKNKDILKTTHWFYFTCSGKQSTVAQAEEDITEVKWIPTQKIKEPMGNTYENIKDIMREFFDTP